MDFESIKRLGIDRYNIDFESADEIYDPSTNNHIIKLHLKKEKTLICPHCGLVNSSRLRSTVKQDIKRSSMLEDNITIQLVRIIYSLCKNGCLFK